MFDYDKSNFISFLKNLPNQIIESQKIIADFKPDIDISHIQILLTQHTKQT